VSALARLLAVAARLLGRDEPDDDDDIAEAREALSGAFEQARKRARAARPVPTMPTPPGVQ